MEDRLMKMRQLFIPMSLIGACIAGIVPAEANGVDIGTYTGAFTNLDQNFGSYMLWTATFGDPNALGAIYAPVEFATYVTNSYANGNGGGNGITDASIYSFGCSTP